MGRTNPTYRDWLDRTEQRWQPFRRALRSRGQDDFDRLFEYAAQHADAAGYLNAAEPEHVMLLSMLLAQERALRELSARVTEIESRDVDESNMEDSNSDAALVEGSERTLVEGSGRTCDGF